MEHGSGKSLFIDGTNYPYWNVRFSAYLQSMSLRVWEILEDEGYKVLVAHVGQDQIDQHGVNSKARNAIFSCLSPPEFDRVSHHATAHEIWKTLEKYHEGTFHVKTRLFETYRREHENFVRLPGESVDSMFSRFQVIVTEQPTPTTSKWVGPNV